MAITAQRRAAKRDSHKATGAAKAKRRNLRGRSKMARAELARALGRS